MSEFADDFEGFFDEAGAGADACAQDAAGGAPEQPCAPGPVPPQMPGGRPGEPGEPKGPVGEGPRGPRPPMPPDCGGPGFDHAERPHAGERPAPDGMRAADAFRPPRGPAPVEPGPGMPPVSDGVDMPPAWEGEPEGGCGPWSEPAPEPGFGWRPGPGPRPEPGPEWGCEHEPSRWSGCGPNPGQGPDFPGPAPAPAAEPEPLLYLDCQSGIAGDMLVAALLDLGASEEALRVALASLPLEGFEAEISRVKKAGIDCCDFNVVLDPEHDGHDHDMAWLHGGDGGAGAESDGSDAPAPGGSAEAVDAVEDAAGRGHGHGHGGGHAHGHGHECEPGHSREHGHPEDAGHGHRHHHDHRGLPEIEAIIDAAVLTPGARELALRTFHILAEAEARAHALPVEQVHFHEVGAVDSIVDIVAAAVLLDDLGIRRVVVPVLVDGYGSIRCQHGIIPVPVPATLNICITYGLPLAQAPVEGELVTPTGAALVAALDPLSVLPARYRVRACGLGAGKRSYARPSVLRAMVIEELEPPAAQGGPGPHPQGWDPRGPHGPHAPQAPLGPHDLQGPQGPHLPQGPRGPYDPHEGQGPRDPHGPQGSRGPHGRRGPQGRGPICPPPASGPDSGPWAPGPDCPPPCGPRPVYGGPPCPPVPPYHDDPGCPPPHGAFLPGDGVPRDPQMPRGPREPWPGPHRASDARGHHGGPPCDGGPRGPHGPYGPSGPRGPECPPPAPPHHGDPGWQSFGGNEPAPRQAPPQPGACPPPGAPAPGLQPGPGAPAPGFPAPGPCEPHGPHSGSRNQAAVPSEAPVDGPEPAASPQEAPDQRECSVIKLECDIDDSTGEQLAYAAERLREAGAREVHWLPIFTKKGRPAWQLQVICMPEDAPRLEGVIFAETSTIGIRRHSMERSVLPRDIELVQTPCGPIRVKCVELPDGQLRRAPEYEDCAAIAREQGVPLHRVMELALRTAEEQAR